MYKMMTPGPTQVRENVRLARSREFRESGSGRRICRIL